MGGRPVSNPHRLFEAIANYTYDWESWLDPEARLLWVNPAVERMTGYSVAQCLAMPDYPLPMVEPADRPRIVEQLRSAVAGESGNDLEFRILRADGGLAWGAVSWQTLHDAGGQVLGVRTSVREITARKEAEAGMREAFEAASRANQAKSRFLAAASHDLRQPLQAASMFLATLRRRLRDESLEELAGSVAACLDNGNSLLDALLDISRLDADVIEPRPERVDLQALLQRIAASFAPLAAERGVTLHLHAPPQSVHTDPMLFGRIVENLLSNAIRYSPGGRVLLAWRRHGDASVRIEVRDNGPGIPPEEHQRVFEEFHQLGNPERDRSKGLGLGLAIVARLAERLELPLGLRSAPGRGSVFSLVLRRAAQPEHPAPVVEAPDTGCLRGRLIAIIDDEPLQRQALALWLQELGCEVVSAASGAGMLKQLSARGASPAAVIADYRLRRGRTGAEAITALRARYGEHLPALLLSGDTEPARLAEAAASGLPLLHKPATGEALSRALAKALSP